MKANFTLMILLSVWLTGEVAGQAPGTLSGDVAPYADFVVASDSTGDYTSVQSAVNAAPDHQSNRTVIFIRNGTYREKLLIPASKIHLTLIGEDADSTILVYGDYARKIVDGEELGTFESQSIRIDANDFKAMNLTFENDARPGGIPDSGQNVAVSCYGDRAVFLHCRFIAWQDTYYSGSDDRQYFKDCFIEGAIDYIFGHTTVIFDSCQIHTARSKGYITAASTLEDYRFGYVFFNCRITAPPGITGVYLGRPWKTYARTVFFECIEYENISPLGWRFWNENEQTCYYAEYNCTGPGSDTSGRVEWSHQLTPAQAGAYTRENIFSSASSPDFSQDWDPGVEEDTLWSIVRRHTPMFMDPVNTDATIASLLVNGEALPDWDPAVYEYSIEVGSDTATMPLLTAEAVNPLAGITIDYPETIPGFATITVLANDRATHSFYRIYFSVEGSYTNSRLDSISIAGSLLEGFDPYILEYDVILPEGTSKYFSLTGYPQVEAATVLYSKPETFPGTASIEVTAVDGETVSNYKLNISLATGIVPEMIPGMRVNAVNPVLDRVEFMIESDDPTRISVVLSDLNGSIIEPVSSHLIDPGKNRLTLEMELSSGLYLYRIGSDVGQTSGILIKSR